MILVFTFLVVFLLCQLSFVNSPSASAALFLPLPAWEHAPKAISFHTQGSRAGALTGHLRTAGELSLFGPLFFRISGL